LNPTILLGSLLNEVRLATTSFGTPVNAAKAAINLAISGVVLDGETVTINNPLVSGTDKYEFLADEAQTKTLPGNIAVDITDYATKASVVLTLDTQPTSGNTMTIGSKVYIFVPDGTDTADGEVSIGTDLASAKLALVAAINGTDEFNVAHPLVSAAAFVGDACTITALVGGTAGNSIVSTETFTAGTNVFATATLAGGTDCSAANAVTALAAAVTASDTQGVGAVDGTGDSVDFTSDAGGVAGNNITVAETMSNGAFAGAATALAGGANGTVGVSGQIMIDSDYLYFCVADNPVTGQNWKRAAITSATF
jgi:hypothetical protein